MHCSASTFALSREGSLTHLLIVIKVIMMDNLMMIAVLMIIIVNIRPLNEGKFHTTAGHFVTVMMENLTVMMTLAYDTMVTVNVDDGQSDNGQIIST